MPPETLPGKLAADPIVAPDMVNHSAKRRRQAALRLSLALRGSIMRLDHTHEAHRRSWVDSANDGLTDFPLQNLPLGVFSPRDGGRRCGVAIGDRILDLRLASERGLISAPVADLVRGDTFNALFELGRPALRTLRHDVFTILEEGSDKKDASLLYPMAECAMHLPTTIGGFADFFVGIHHAVRCGEIINGSDYQLPLNYHYMPLAYNGRASTIYPSGQDIRRPIGLRKRLYLDDLPSFGPCQWMDFELEVGFYVGPPNEAGEPVPISRAEDRIIGFCLVNDWSARDIQMFEQVPLGAFTGKSTGTTVSPWVITADAMEPFRSGAMPRYSEAPAIPEYLDDANNQKCGGIDVALTATIWTEKMREAGENSTQLLRSHTRYMYWTCAQMLAQHSITGCILQSGDLIASGTISGPTRADLASFFELSFVGKEPITLPNGESRGFIEDGDEIAFFGRCERDDFVPIGFGTCMGRLTPALSTIFS